MKPIVSIESAGDAPKKSRVFKEYELIRIKSGLAPRRLPKDIKEIMEERERSGIQLARQKPPLSTQDVEVGPYVIHVEKRAKTCSLKLLENIEGEDWEQRVRGIWSGDPGSCDGKVRKILGVINEVRAENRRMPGVVRAEGSTTEEREVKYRVILDAADKEIQLRHSKPMSGNAAWDFAKGLSVGVKGKVRVVDASDPEFTRWTFERGSRIGE